MTAKTKYVGARELTALLAEAGVSRTEWADIAPVATYAWPDTPKYLRNVVNRILGAAKASRAQAQEEDRNH